MGRFAHGFEARDQHSHHREADFNSAQVDGHDLSRASAFQGFEHELEIIKERRRVTSRRGPELPFRAGTSELRTKCGKSVQRSRWLIYRKAEIVPRASDDR